MAKTIGVTLSEQVLAGLVVDHKLVGDLRRFPADEEERDALIEMHTDGLVQTICDQVAAAANGENDLAGVGVAVPGLIKNGVVEEAPNLPQLKGARLKDLVGAQLRERGIKAPVTILNDADGVAAGLAARHGKLDHMIRVWTMRRAGAPGRRDGVSGDAAAVSRHGAGRGVRGGEGGGCAVYGVQAAVA
jgi:glucokinase